MIDAMQFPTLTLQRLNQSRCYGRVHSTAVIALKLPT